MGTCGSKKKIGKKVKCHHDASMLNSAPRLAQSHVFDTSDLCQQGVEQPVWEKRIPEVCFNYKDEVPIYIDPTEETNAELHESRVYVFKETVFDKWRSLPPIPPIPPTDSLYSENCYDQINDNSSNMSYESPKGASSINMSKRRAAPAAPIKSKEAPIQKWESHEANSWPTQTMSHEVSECLGYEEMVEIFKPLIIKNLLVREILPHLPFIEDHEDLYVADRRSPSEAVVCLLRELKSCKEVGKWHKFLEALQLCGYEYIVQNIKGYRFINHKYQTEYLKSLTPKLSKVIRARELLPRLYAEDIISQNDREEIEKQDDMHGNIAAATMLLNRITRKLPDWYTKFITALREEGFSSIADGYLDIPHLTSSERVKVQKLSEKEAGELNANHPTPLVSRREIIKSTLLWRERHPKPLPPLPANIEQDVQEELYDDLDILMDIAPPLPPRGIPNTYSLDNRDIYDSNTYDNDSSDQVRCNVSPIPPVSATLFSNEEYSEYDLYSIESFTPPAHRFRRPPPPIPSLRRPPRMPPPPIPSLPRPPRMSSPPRPSPQHGRLFRLPSPSSPTNSKHSKSDDQNRDMCKYTTTQSNKETITDEFYGYEPYDEYEPQQNKCDQLVEMDISQEEEHELSTYQNLSENGTERDNEANTGDKFHALKQEVYTLQGEGNDLDEEIKHLLDKNDLQGNVNDKLKRKRELLQSISIKEKEATALKAPVSSPETDDYYCPESARMFWRNRSSVCNSTTKTTLHFPNEFQADSTVLSNTPVMIYDPKFVHGKKAWSYNDSAIDCVY